jgi:hypothetical protein
LRQYTTLWIIGCLTVTWFFIWLLRHIDYRLTDRALEITLFGFRVRRIPFSDIRRVSKHRSLWCEKWPNTLLPIKRILVIHRRSGIFRKLLITPENRYVFKARLKQAIKATRNRTAQEFEDDAGEQDLEHKPAV